MRKLKEHKVIIIFLAVLLAAAAIVSVLTFYPVNTTNENTEESAEQESSIGNMVSISPIDTEKNGVNSGDSYSSYTSDSLHNNNESTSGRGFQNDSILDVNGNPVNNPSVTASGENNLSLNGENEYSPNAATSNAPYANITQTPDGTNPQATVSTGQNQSQQTIESELPILTPDEPSHGDTSKPAPNIPATSSNQNDSGNWTPPAPGVGTGELISSGFENIKISTDKSIEKLQYEMGLLTGSFIEDAGYTTLYTNAGTAQKMVENAVENYAKTGEILLNPADYGLPKLIGEYHTKLEIKGTNAVEAAEYISDYLIADKAFNDKVKSVFSQYKDGFLSVYQKDGYFYVLFAVIDIGYVN